MVHCAAGPKHRVECIMPRKEVGSCKRTVGDFAVTPWQRKRPAAPRDDNDLYAEVAVPVVSLLLPAIQNIIAMYMRLLCAFSCVRSQADYINAVHMLAISRKIYSRTITLLMHLISVHPSGHVCRRSGQ